jgi:hypothetical protein
MLAGRGLEAFFERMVKFPELSTSKVVTWQAHVDDKSSSKEAAYDMIMGMDLMTSIGITVDYEQRCIRWGGTEIPLKTRNIFYDDEMLHMLYNAANERHVQGPLHSPPFSTL